MSKRRNFSPEFRAKVALDAIRGEKTITELSSRYDVHANLIRKWKKQALDNMADLFAGKAERREKATEAQIEKLHAKIGQLTVERDFLAKAFDR